MSNFSRNDIKQFFQDTARERLNEGTRLTSPLGTELYGGPYEDMGVSDADLERAHNDEMGLRFFHPKNDKYALDDPEDIFHKGKVDLVPGDEFERFERALNRRSSPIDYEDYEDGEVEMPMPKLFDDAPVTERKKIRKMVIELLRENAKRTVAGVIEHFKNNPRLWRMSEPDFYHMKGGDPMPGIRDKYPGWSDADFEAVWNALESSPNDELINRPTIDIVQKANHYLNNFDLSAVRDITVVADENYPVEGVEWLTQPVAQEIMQEMLKKAIGKVLYPDSGSPDYSLIEDLIVFAMTGRAP